MGASRILLISLMLFVVASTIPLSVHAAPAPTLQASGDPTVPPLYTLRDKQASLTGSGYTSSRAYYIWVMGPNDNSTHYSGTGFTATTTGQVPQGEAVPISTNATLGTYLVSVSNSSSSDTGQARAHFGIWGTVKPLYQRTESVMIVGGGLFPGVSAKISIRNPTGDYVVAATVASGVHGDFNYTWRVSPDSVTETYTVIIDGTGTYDNPQQDYVSESKFTVTQAVLSAKISSQPNPSYQRTEQANVMFTLTYPDGSPVTQSEPNLQPVALLQNQTTVASLPVTLADKANGIWSAKVKTLTNATLSSNYRFELPAAAFDDGFGNKGGAVDIASDYFQVRAANLSIVSEVNGTLIQVPFGQVSVISRASYPDNSPLTNGTVTVLVSTGRSTSQLKLVYDPSIAAWRGSYSSGFWDIWSVGKWTLTVQASDAFGNLGSSTFTVVAQPYLFLILIAVIIGVALFARWTTGRYGRKVYLRIRKLLQKMRSMSTERTRP